MRVLLINQAYAPDVAATAQHAEDLGRALVARGHEVHVVASRSIYGRAGAALPRRETRHGVRVHRVAPAIFGKRLLPLRAVDFASFWLRSALAALTTPRPDVVVPFTTPPFVVGVGLLVRRLRSRAARPVKVVNWLMDLYPDTPVACGVLGADSLLARIAERVHRGLLSRCDRVVVLGRCMRDRVLAKGVAAERLALIRPWADADEIRPTPPDEVALRAEWRLDGDDPPGSRCVVQYSGNLGIAHDAKTIADAVLRLNGDPKLRFLFVGGGRRVDELAAALGDAASVQVRPYQPRERLGETLCVGDVHLASLVPAALGCMVPSKLFGILAAGRPVVFVGPSGSEVARLIAEHDCGRVVANGDVDGLVATLRELCSDPALRRRLGANGRRALEAELSRERACARWANLLEDLARSDS